LSGCRARLDRSPRRTGAGPVGGCSGAAVADRGGKIKALGAASGARNPKLPNVPTLAEQGLPDTQADNWYGLLAPARTPPAVIAKLNGAIVAALNDSAIRDKLVQSG